MDRIANEVGAGREVVEARGRAVLLLLVGVFDSSLLSSVATIVD